MKSAAKPPVVSCPICGAAVAWTVENRWRPFCSERCKLIDLGQWATEKYRVPVVEQDPEDESDVPPTQ
ncbi:MAG: DNA gyrase inhibitor YacG [Gammaproteobacteria bacterium]|nr:DNA gyrase inhibitor YacG [Gammaproteobacteria bacterium]MBU1408407.1 DNA gyrase inhibitor YacG [Gammaproteobacteria bacterium]MBU1532219.1 DNA gyrase inhibitor YacG [Gammaproteobacteria bacterium]